MIPITLVIETSIYWYYGREIGVNANFWRVAILYVVGLVTEGAVLIFLISIWPNTGWTSTFIATYGTVLFCIAVSIIIKYLVSMTLYKQSTHSRIKLLGIVNVASLGGYMSALIWVLIVIASSN